MWNVASSNWFWATPSGRNQSDEIWTITALKSRKTLECRAVLTLGKTVMVCFSTQELPNCNEESFPSSCHQVTIKRQMFHQSLFITVCHHYLQCSNFSVKLWQRTISKINLWAVLTDGHHRREAKLRKVQRFLWCLGSVLEPSSKRDPARPTDPGVKVTTRSDVMNVSGITPGVQITNLIHPVRLNLHNPDRKLEP